MGVINKSINVYSNAKESHVILKIKGKVITKKEAMVPENTLDNTASPVKK